MDKILFVEDDQRLADGLTFHFKKQELALEHAADGNLGLEMALKGGYNLIILDGGLPGLDGFEVLQKIREKDERTPVLMLTARSDNIDKVVALEFGADDYVTKPYDLGELNARVHSLIRRGKLTQSATTDISPDGETREDINIGNLVVKPALRTAFIDGSELSLTTREFDLLLYLVEAKGKPISRDVILEKIWELSADVYDSSLTIAVSRLRKKIEKDPSNPKYIITVKGFGYKIPAEVET